MAFNNVSLGYVHAMAHQLGGLYDLPHGVCNAILLPYVQEFNARASAARLRDIAEAMGEDTKGMTDQEGADACALTNPVQASCQDIEALFHKAM